MYTAVLLCIHCIQCLVTCIRVSVYTCIQFLCIQVCEMSGQVFEVSGQVFEVSGQVSKMSVQVSGQVYTCVGHMYTGVLTERGSITLPK